MTSQKLANIKRVARQYHRHPAGSPKGGQFAPRNGLRKLKSMRSALSDESMPPGLSGANAEFFRAAAGAGSMSVSSKDVAIAQPFFQKKELLGKEIVKPIVTKIRAVHPDLKEDEAWAIARYMGGGYKEMNSPFYGEDNDEAVTAVNKLAFNGLKKMPAVTSAQIEAYTKGSPEARYSPIRGLQRGLQITDGATMASIIKRHEDALAGGGYIREEGWFATSTMDVSKNEVALAKDSNVIYHVQPRLDGAGQGRFIDPYKNGLVEGEVMFPPYSRFRVVEVKRQGNITALADLPDAVKNESLQYEDYLYYKEMSGRKWKQDWKDYNDTDPPSASDLKRLKSSYENVQKALKDSADARVDIYLVEE